MTRRYTLIILIQLLTVISAFSQGENFNLIVNSPASVAGTYDLSSTSAFGAADCASEISGELALANAGTDTQACASARSFGLDVEGKIAVVDRGTCSFIEKAEVLQDFGAIAMIVCNDVPNDTLIALGASDEDIAAINITIPTFFMRLSDCNTLKAEIDGGAIMVTTERLDFGFVDQNSDDVVLFTEDFTGGLNGWEAEGLFCGDGANADNALWEWRDGGDLGRGLYGNPLLEMISTTPCDGFVVFDSDLLDSGESALGNGPCPVFQEGTITSPVIDLSTIPEAGDLIGIKFTQGVRPFDAEFFLEWTTDGGTSWEQLQINTNLEANESSFELQRFPLSGVTGSDQLQVRFRFARDYYFWALDDIEIINFTGINAKINDAFYTPLSYATPITHADADTFLFATEVINNGAIPIDVRFTIDISNNETREQVHIDSVDFNNIQPQDTAFIAIQNVDTGEPRLWVPNELEVGLYRMEYNIEVIGEEESNLTDNSTTFFFAITDDLFSKGGGSSPTAFRYAGADDQWGIGAFFKTANGVGKFKAEAIEFGAFTAVTGATMENFIAEVALLKQVGAEATFFPTGFENENNSYLNHPNFEIVYQGTHVFTEDTSAVEFVSIDISNEGIDDLEPGTGYVVMIFFDDNVTSTAGIANKELALVADDDVEMSGVYIYLPDRNPSYYTGFSDFTPPGPLVVLDIALTSPVDEVPLPEHSLKAYPNPVGQIMTAELSFDKPTDVSLILAGIDGRIINVQNLNNVTTEAHPVDVTGLPNGTYMLRVASNEGTKTIPIIVQH